MNRDEVRERQGDNPMPDGLGAAYYQPPGVVPIGGDEDRPAGEAILDVPDIRQESDYDCGPAALAAALGFLGLPADRGAFMTALATTVKGTTPEAVMLYACTLPEVLMTAGGNLEIADLAHFFAAGHPSLCPIQAGPASGESSGHWVVVIGVALGQVFFHDPAAGRRMLSEEDFLAAWHDGGYQQFAIALGLEIPVVDVPPEDAETEPDDSPEPKDDARAAVGKALESLVSATLTRMVNRVGTHAERACKKPQTFQSGFLDQMCGEHIGPIADALCQPLAALSAHRGRGLLAPEAVAGRLLRDLHALLLDASGRASPAKLPEEVGNAISDAARDPMNLPSLKELMR
jgi:hypothetical protein